MIKNNNNNNNNNINIIMITNFYSFLMQLTLTG